MGREIIERMLPLDSFCTFLIETNGFDTEIKGAPEFWRDLDPYWKGAGPLMRRYFHPDGSLTADRSDKVWGGHECCYTVVTSFTGEKLRTIRKHYVRINRWPEISVFRNLDWSWKMSNFLFCYDSVHDADKEGGTGPFLLP